MDIARNVGWLRKCLKLQPAAREPLYFLARSYDVANQIKQALEHYSAYVARTEDIKKGELKKWRAEAVKRMEELNQASA